METVAILLGLAFAINKTVSVVKGLLARDFNIPLTQVIVWVVGFGGVALAAHADVTSTLIVPGLSSSLGDMDGSSLVLLAWVLGSTGSFAFDFKKAIDNTDTSIEPKLINNTP